MSIPSLDVAALEIVVKFVALASAAVFAVSVHEIGAWTRLTRSGHTRPQLHHFYAGLPFLAAPERWGYWAVASWVFGTLLMAADARQHWKQRTDPAYRSPEHRLWVKIALYLASRSWMPNRVRSWLLT